MSRPPDEVFVRTPRIVGRTERTYSLYSRLQTYQPSMDIEIDEYAGVVNS